MQIIELNEEMLKVVLEGKSSIDSFNFLKIDSMEQAKSFMQNYGVCIHNPIEMAESLGNFYEAIGFIRKFFLQPANPEGLKGIIPRRILEMKDIRNFLLCLSDSGELKKWAISILKVMHVISHMDKDIRNPYFPEIQKQILNRFYAHIFEKKNQLFFGQRHNIPLIDFQVKPRKSRESIMIKLLQKPEVNSEDVFDQVGVRFVTRNVIDVLKVIQVLQDEMVIILSNIKSSRSRNTLLDMDSFREHILKKTTVLRLSHISQKDFIDQLSQQLMFKGQSSTQNPHSAQEYRSIHFTCKQLIKFNNPLYSQIKQLRQQCAHLGKIDLDAVQKHISFFYPYEVQIVDQNSAQENEKGQCAHRQYKAAQVKTALNRVFSHFV